jgi:hypothetical protein
MWKMDMAFDTTMVELSLVKLIDQWILHMNMEYIPCNKCDCQLRLFINLVNQQHAFI